MWSFDEISRDFRHVIKKMEITLFEKNIMTFCLGMMYILQILFPKRAQEVIQQVSSYLKYFFDQQCANLTLFFLQPY